MKKSISVCLVLLTVIFMLAGCDFDKSYTGARERTIKYFMDNQSDFETAKDTVLTTQSTDNVSIEDIVHIGFHTVETGEVITFDYDAQGMLGGQYWGIVFSSDDIPRYDIGITALAESEIEGIYYWDETEGNNFLALERISENWFFYYMDYDGHLNVSNLVKQ